MGFTLPWEALPAQQLWALHFHEFCLHNNGGLYTSMRSSTCTTMVGFTLPWQALHFLKSPPFPISHPPPHSQFSSSSHWFMTSKSASVFTQGKDLSCGLHWNHAHAWLCLAGPLFQWGLRLYRPLILTRTNHPCAVFQNLSSEFLTSHLTY